MILTIEPVDLPRFRVFGTPIHAVDLPATEGILRAFLDTRVPRQVATVNVDFLRIAAASPSFNHVLDETDLVVADGRPLVWLARYLGLKACGRVTGIDIIEACARLSQQHGYRIFLLGGADGVAEEAKRRLETSVPGVTICGTYSPPPSDYPFPDQVEEVICQRVREAAPDILFVAFGCPKQEFWIRDHCKSLNVPLAVGIGGSFNFLCGTVKRAPGLVQSLGLEWVYRLYREPRRLWRRYLLGDLPFAARLIAAELVCRLGLRRKAVLRIED
jgi:N-acetylglucosaminyldiphosphoundecaprenol N-acetyl-beta-D-mannosaminyltransferase